MKGKGDIPSFSVIWTFSTSSPSSALDSFKISPKLFPLFSSVFSVLDSVSFSLSTGAASVAAGAGTGADFLAKGDDVEE
jgi:hypothetical protein